MINKLQTNFYHCIYFALGLHLLLFLFLGVHYKSTDKIKTSPTLEVQLTLPRFEPMPKQAKLIGNANQQGALIREAHQDHIMAFLPSATQASTLSNPKTLTQQQSDWTLAHNQEKKEETEAPNEATQQKPLMVWQNPNSSKGYQRKRTISAAIHQRFDAAYLKAWEQRIERIGNQNYPKLAKQQGLSGYVVLRVSINADGSLRQIDLVRSSGEKIFDEAAIKTIQLAAPFAPLTNEMREHSEILQITRTWRYGL